MLVQNIKFSVFHQHLFINGPGILLCGRNTVAIKTELLPFLKLTFQNNKIISKQTRKEHQQ